MIQQNPSNNSSATPDHDFVVVTKGLVKKFGKTVALNGVDLTVPRGSVYALLGRNGVGKSTIMQILMGMLDPTEGTVSVLGLNPTKDGVELKTKVGYIPDRLPMYEWMKVSEMLKFCGAMYKNWSTEDEIDLVKRFGIKLDMKVSALSRGYRALLALVLAMSHQPEMVLLDEVTSGMDAIARQEFERSVIDALQDKRRTVVFSGHQIDEMERISDWVGIMHEGKMLLQMPIDDLKRCVRMLRIGGVEGDVVMLPGCNILHQRRVGRDLMVTVRLPSAVSDLPRLPEQAIMHEEIPMSLEEIFVALVDTESRQ